ncbi:MAG TPA: saccharopine dehydrogenase C-terminal domain-containing protein, partial [Acidobacteriota bacterium]|nr:saccharopine dehydrogenase C-terminal domain-containing protein [Acidobacteriota bacterium]
MKKAIVLGCGLVGSAIVRDLAADEDFVVTAADSAEKSLEAVSNVPGVNRIQRDLGNSALVQDLVSDFDVVLGALPSRLGLATLRAVIESGKPYADISFMNDDPLQLNDLARAKGVTAVVDCGVAPGLANMIIGHCSAELDEVERAEYLVGGLPKPRYWPYQYRATFSPFDVIEEYLRPARMVEDGRVVVKPALSDPELITFPKVGTLEAFNTDGLRSLIKTVPAKNMKEKTLRYPGHRDLMCVLRDTGFLGKERIEVNGTSVVPLDVTAKLLFPMWTRPPGEPEFTLLRVLVEGSSDGQKRRYTYDLYDEYDPIKDMTSMARTTGFPCAIVARRLVDGSLRMPGIQPPEMLGKNEGMLA